MTTIERTSDRTSEILAAMESATKLIHKHGLYAGSLDFEPSHPGAMRYDRSTQDWALPVIPKVRVILFGRPNEFLRWCRVIDAERVEVKRRDLDTCLWANADMGGLTWSLASSISRRVTGGPHLPGISPDWKRLSSGRRGNEALISVEDLATSLSAVAALGDQQ